MRSSLTVLWAVALVLSGCVAAPAGETEAQKVARIVRSACAGFPLVHATFVAVVDSGSVKIDPEVILWEGGLATAVDAACSEFHKSPDMDLTQLNDILKVALNATTAVANYVANVKR